MSISLKKTQEQEYIVLHNRQEIGSIKTYDNDFHAKNCYVKLDLETYDTSISHQLFDKLIKEINRPLQVMLSSDEHELISFVEKGGFICKRKCYEMEVTRENYIPAECKDVVVQTCTRGSVEYDMCCKLLHEYYAKVHERINPLTVDLPTFSGKLP